MTLQNEHILMEEAHRRVAEKLHEAELERFGRKPRRPRQVAAVVASAVVVVAAVAGVLGLGPW